MDRSFIQPPAPVDQVRVRALVPVPLGDAVAYTALAALGLVAGMLGALLVAA